MLEALHEQATRSIVQGMNPGRQFSPARASYGNSEEPQDAGPPMSTQDPTHTSRHKPMTLEKTLSFTLDSRGSTLADGDGGAHALRHTGGALLDRCNPSGPSR
jgi:hypothetical protein